MLFDILIDNPINKLMNQLSDYIHLDESRFIGFCILTVCSVVVMSNWMQRYVQRYFRILLNVMRK